MDLFYYSLFVKNLYCFLILQCGYTAHRDLKAAQNILDIAMDERHVQLKVDGDQVSSVGNEVKGHPHKKEINPINLDDQSFDYDVHGGITFSQAEQIKEKGA